MQNAFSLEPTGFTIGRLGVDMFARGKGEDQPRRAMSLSGLVRYTSRRIRLFGAYTHSYPENEASSPFFIFHHFQFSYSVINDDINTI
jgi:hypothetical protein